MPHSVMVSAGCLVTLHVAGDVITAAWVVVETVHERRDSAGETRCSGGGESCGSASSIT